MKAGRSPQAPARVALTSLESLGEEQALVAGVESSLVVESLQALALAQNLGHDSFLASQNY